MSKPVNIRKRLGVLRRSPVDAGRYRFMLRAPTAEEVTRIQAVPEYDGLAAYMPVAADQGDVGTCVGFGSVAVKKSMEALQNARTPLLSPACAYRWSQIFSDPPIPPNQEGSTLLGALKALQKRGVGTEACVPTDTKTPFTYQECSNVLEIAEAYKIGPYHNVPLDEYSIKAAILGITFTQPYLMSDGSPGCAPLLAAILVYANFKEAAATGVVPTPEGEFRGGHCVALRGWRLIDGALYWRVTNSWGTWGDGGTIYLPADYPLYEAWLLEEGAPSPGPDPEPVNPPTPKPWWVEWWEWLLHVLGFDME